jgi:hypothetical protein
MMSRYGKQYQIVLNSNKYYYYPIATVSKVCFFFADMSYGDRHGVSHCPSAPGCDMAV